MLFWRILEIKPAHFNALYIEMISDSGKYNATARHKKSLCDFEFLYQKDCHSSCLQAATSIVEHGNEVKQARGSSGLRKICQKDLSKIRKTRYSFCLIIHSVNIFRFGMVSYNKSYVFFKKKWWGEMWLELVILKTIWAFPIPLIPTWNNKPTNSSCVGSFDTLLTSLNAMSNCFLYYYAPKSLTSTLSDHRIDHLQ